MRNPMGSTLGHFSPYYIATALSVGEILNARLSFEFIALVMYPFVSSCDKVFATVLLSIINCKIDGFGAMCLKSEFVKKV